MPLIERIRERAQATAEASDDPDAVLDFYAAALALGCSPEYAEQVDADLTERVMRSRGAI